MTDPDTSLTREKIPLGTGFQANLARRISLSIIVMAVTLTLAIVTTKIEAIPST